MISIRQDFEQYILENYPGVRVDTEHTLAGKITIKFDATQDDYATIEKRANQAIERSLVIFHMLFGNVNFPIWILAYEYINDEVFEYDNEYLFKQFKGEQIFNFVTNKEIVNSRMMTWDEKGNEILEKVLAKVTVGKIVPIDIRINTILKGVVNKELAIEPSINHSLYFFDPINHTGFHIYDDRGFFIWAKQTDKLRSIYEVYKEWVSIDAKEEIAELFL